MDGYKLNIIIDREACSGCEECVEVCDYDCFTIDENHIAVFDNKACIMCMDCDGVCINGAIDVV